MPPTNCEDCGFELPADWPKTEVVVAALHTLTAPRLLCDPCGRRALLSADAPPRTGMTIDYRSLAPHVPAGRKRS